MKSHPHRGTRLLAWRIIRKWYHLYAGLGEDLREQWVWNGTTREGEGEGVAPIPNYPQHYQEEYMKEFGSWSGESVEVDLLPLWDQELIGVARFIEGGIQVDVRERGVDVWLLPMMEDIRSNEERANLSTISAIPTEWINAETMAIIAAEKQMGKIEETELSSFVVCVEGYLLFREGLLPSSSSPSTTTSTTTPLLPISVSSQPLPEPFVSTPATSTLIRSLALHLQRRLPVLISSPSSAGKASVIRHLWSTLHSLPSTTTSSGVTEAGRKRGLVTINLADRSLDSKSLLGSLSSAPSSADTEAGTFVFVEGPLTRAVRQGRWVVLTSIDQASVEVLTVIKVLAERMKRASESSIGGSYGGGTNEENGGVGVRVSGGSGRWVPAGRGFMLFATRSVESVSLSRPAEANFFAAHFFSEVWMTAPHAQEIAMIVEGRYERLAANGLSTRLIGVWERTRAVAVREGGAGTGRTVGVRDLLRCAFSVLFSSFFLHDTDAYDVEYIGGAVE